MKKLLAWFTRVTPLRISMFIALVFVVAHFVIDTGFFEHGFFSRKGYLRSLDLKLLDSKFQYAALDESPDPQVVVAAIDEESIEKYGLFPWSRKVLAQFVDALSKHEPSVIAFDIVFSNEDKNQSYMGVKRFLDAFEASALPPDSTTFAVLEKRVAESEERFSQAAKRVESLKGSIRKDLKGAQRNQLMRLIAEASKESGQAKTELETARKALADLKKSSGEFLQLMKDQVSEISPDAAFAESIEKAENVVLGYFAYLNEEEIKDVPLEEQQRDIETLEPVVLDAIYEPMIEELGGAVLERFDAVPVDWDRLQFKEAVGFQAPLPRFAERARSMGFFNAEPDSDNNLRRVRMFYKKGKKIYPSLALQAASIYYDDTPYPENNPIRPGRTISGISIGTQRHIVTDRQSKMLVNYYADPQEYFPVCGIAAIIEGRCEALGNDMSRLKDKVVIVGATAIGTYDLRPIAFGTVPGVFIHAMAIQNILDGRFLQRFEGIQLYEIALFLFTGLLLGLIIHRVPPWASLLVVSGVTFTYYAVDLYWAFPRGFWLVNVLPTLQWAFTFGAIVFYKYLTEGREKRQIRQAFQFYLTKSVVDEMLKDTSKLKLGGERRVCTVLFSDIRGFTTISESLEPEELSALLNEYLTPMTNLVFKYDGTLDKYMGDAIMAIFGAPVPYSDHAARACLVALEMMEELGNLKRKWAAEGSAHSLDIGIGLNTGPMSVGNMGSEVRFDYTVMGDQVNLGSRLEGINKQYGTNIIISEFTYEAAKADIHARELDLVRVKGKNEPVRIYELIGKGKATGNAADLIEQFERAIQAYRSQNWTDAIALFERIRTDLKPGDFASQMYIDRCVQLRSQDMGPGWDGVFTMTTK